MSPDDPAYAWPTSRASRWCRRQELRAAQAAHPPFGDYLCIEPQAVARIHGTSGTTGRPDRVRHRRRRLGAHRRGACAGHVGARASGPRDSRARLLLLQPVSRARGARWWARSGSGATVFPFGAGVAGQTLTRRAVGAQTAADARSTARRPTRCTSRRRRGEEGVDPRTLGLPHSCSSRASRARAFPPPRRSIEATFGGLCVDMGSMAEMTPWMTNGECRHRTGMHLWQDLVYTRGVRPGDATRRVPYGGEGTPVYTHLERTSQPMIRLRVGRPARAGRTSRARAGAPIRGCPPGSTAASTTCSSCAARTSTRARSKTRCARCRASAASSASSSPGARPMDELLVRVEYAASHAGAERLDALRRRAARAAARAAGRAPGGGAGPGGHARRAPSSRPAA